MQFYKYTGESGINILEGLRLKVTPPNQFNDPFELTPRSKLRITLQYLLDQLRKEPEWFRNAYDDMVLYENYPHSFEAFLSAMPHILPQKFKEFKKYYRDALIENDLKSLDQGSRYMGLLCVSKPNNSIPMWSHYANHHRGMAFGLEMNHACFRNGYYTEFVKVRYRQKRFPVEALLPIGNQQLRLQLKAVISTKGPDWRYEQEHRGIYRLDELVGPDKRGHYFLHIDSSAIREIIFGCRIDPPFEQKIREELKRRPKTFGHIKLRRCKRHGSRFEIEIVPT